MNDTYFTLEKIWGGYLDGEQLNLEKEIRDLLAMHGIGARRDDGELKQVTISRPTSIESSFVVGLRYTKKDGTYTEDHFLCRKNPESSMGPVEIDHFYKGRLERKLPEYKGTHKEQVEPDRTAIYDGTTMQVNTISYFIGEKL